MQMSYCVAVGLNLVIALAIEAKGKFNYRAFCRLWNGSEGLGEEGKGGRCVLPWYCLSGRIRFQSTNHLTRKVMSSAVGSNYWTVVTAISAGRLFDKVRLIIIYTFNYKNLNSRYVHSSIE